MVSSLSTQLNVSCRKYAASYSGLPSIAWQGMLIHFVESTLVGLSYFLTLYLMNEKHFSISQAGLQMSYLGLGTIAGSFLGGKLSDKYSPGHVVILGLFLQASAYIALTISSPAQLLSVILFMLGLGSYGFITASYSWILGACGNNENCRIKAINLLSISANLGFGLSAIVIGMISTNRFIFLFLVSSLLLYLTGIYFFFLNRTNKKIVITKTLSSMPSFSFFSNKSKTDLAVIMFALIAVFSAGIIISQMNSTYPLYIQEMLPAEGIKAISAIFAINTFMVVVFQAPLVDAFHRFNSIMLVSIGVFLLGAGMIFVCLAPTFLMAATGCIIHTIGEILLFSFAQLICYEKVHDQYKGQMLGIYRMVFATSRMLGPALGGYIYQLWSGEVLWILCFLLGTVWLVIGYYFKTYPFFSGNSRDDYQHNT